MAVQPETCLDHTEDGSSGEITTARQGSHHHAICPSLCFETCERKYGAPGGLSPYHRHIFQLVGALSHWFYTIFLISLMPIHIIFLMEWLILFHKILYTYMFGVLNLLFSIAALPCYVSFYCTTNYTYSPSIFGFPSHSGHPRAWTEFLCYTLGTKVVTYFICSVNNEYISIPISLLGS